MRLSNTQAVARPVYYDRNPVNQTKAFAVAAAVPHGGVTRFSYTVPVGKKAFLDTLNLVIHRITAAAPAGQVEAFVAYTPSGGAQVDLQYIALLTNNVGDFRSTSLTGVGTLFAGDVIAVLDDDASTGGTVTYIEALKVAEFDA